MMSGFWTNTRIMTSLSGPYSTVVVESDEESLTVFEARMATDRQDPRFQALAKRVFALVEDGRREFHNLVE